MTFLKKLREAARKCSSAQYAQALRDAADKLAYQIDVLNAAPTTENMLMLNGYWASADRVLKNMPPEADPNTPLSGPSEPARLAA